MNADTTAECLKLWRHLFGGERGYLCGFTGERGSANDELEKRQQEFFEYPREAQAAAEFLIAESEKGREAYFTAHLLTRRGQRKKGAAARVRALWADLDGAKVPAEPTPTAIVESSPGHYHCYWRLATALEPEQAERLNRRLTYAIGADRGKWALTCLLRPPGTSNHKHGAPSAVLLRDTDPRTEINPDELERWLPMAGPSANGHQGGRPNGKEPPVRLDSYGMEVWRGEKPKVKDGRVDRSASLFAIGRVLYRAGATRSALVAALRERDAALGWHKYTAYADDGEYDRIYSKLVGPEQANTGPAPDGDEGDESSREPQHEDFARTDLGNAERLVARHGDDLLYVHKWKKWLVWDGKRWAIDTSGEVERRAVATVRAIYGEAKRHPDDAVRKALARHAVASESRARIEAMISLARSRPGIPVDPEQLDRDLWLLNARNGTLDLRTRELREHSREDRLTKLAPVEYAPDADAPRFLGFLSEIFGGDEDVISFVRRFAGYTLTGSTEERVFAILHGSGKNGKTTLVELLRDVLGEYAENTDAETILQKDYRGVGNDVAALCGARFVSAAEVEQGRYLAESRVKNLTGADTVTARFLFSEPFNFKPQFKLWLSTNNKPVIRGTDDAIWDRIRLIPFEQRFDGERCDPKLPAKLREELPGVLAWMVQGCREWRREGLGEPEKIQKATEGYRAEMDALAAFIDECCVVRPDVQAKFKLLYEAYCEWCEDSNEKVEKKRRFADLLTERGFEKAHGTDNVAIRRGIALRHDGAPDPSRITDPDPKDGQEPTSDPPESTKDVNSTGGELTIDNSQNSCKTGGSQKRINDNYRRTEVLGLEKTSRERISNNVNDRYFVNPGGRLTPEQVEKWKRLVREGMDRDLARASVLGEAVEL
jgi:P4 family phage/plasmid primase-like protien